MSGIADSRRQSNIDLSLYDFIDVGANKGHSYNWAVEKLGGIKGLCVDINAKQVMKLNALGIDSIIADCRDLWFPANSFRIGVLSHVLEHLGNMGDVTVTLNRMSRVVQDVLVIRQPWFDEVGYLSTLGLKSVGASLTIHPLHLTVKDFVDVFYATGARDYAIYGSERMKSSLHLSGWIVKGEARPDTKGWKKEPEFRPPNIIFTRPVFQELYVIVRLSNDQHSMRAVEAIPARRVLVKSAYHFESLPD